MRAEIRTLVFTVTGILVVSRLTGVLDWSWWWVLAPVWITLALSILCYTIAYAIEGFIYARMTKDEKTRHRASEALKKYSLALRRRGF